MVDPLPAGTADAAIGALTFIVEWFGTQESYVSIDDRINHMHASDSIASVNIALYRAQFPHRDATLAKGLAAFQELSAMVGNAHAAHVHWLQAGHDEDYHAPPSPLPSPPQSESGDVAPPPVEELEDVAVDPLPVGTTDAAIGALTFMVEWFGIQESYVSIDDRTDHMHASDTIASVNRALYMAQFHHRDATLTKALAACQELAVMMQAAHTAHSHWLVEHDEYHGPLAPWEYD